MCHFKICQKMIYTILKSNYIFVLSCLFFRKKPYDLDDPNVKPWTGFGFQQVNEGSELIFDIPGSAIRKDLDYNLVIRHQHQPDSPNQWKEATVQLLLGTIHTLRNHL